MDKNRGSDQDFYKYSMQNALVVYENGDKIVEYKFKHRNGNGFPRNITKEYFMYILRTEFRKLCEEFVLNATSLEYIRNLVKNNEYVPRKLDQVNIFVEDINGELEITVKGLWEDVIHFEIPVLSIFSENFIYNDNRDYKKLVGGGIRNLREKIKWLKEQEDIDGFKFIDFGTRRRFSANWHDYVVGKLLKELPEHFIGTSNVALAQKYNIMCSGTMAHEWLQAYQQIVAPEDFERFQEVALYDWYNVYKGDLGIALTDVVGFDAFLKVFNIDLANKYAGCRHDSGCPFEWCDKLIKHYETLGIDPMTKVAVFSDSLDFEKAVTLYRRFRSRIKMVFGIGTYLTNDMGEGYVAPSVVMKMVTLENRPVCKLSDSNGKEMCRDQEYMDMVKKTFKG